jgi:Lon-like ATP-dependent protease
MPEDTQTHKMVRIGGIHVPEDELVNEAASSAEDEVADEGPVEEEPLVTIWSPESGNNVDLNETPIDEWVRSIDFDSTEDVPIPERLVDQVIGQEAGSVVIKKAAEQRRHMMMINASEVYDRTLTPR